MEGWKHKIFEFEIGRQNHEQNKKQMIEFYANLFYKINKEIYAIKKAVNKKIGPFEVVRIDRLLTSMGEEIPDHMVRTGYREYKSKLYNNETIPFADVNIRMDELFKHEKTLSEFKSFFMIVCFLIISCIWIGAIIKFCL